MFHRKAVILSMSFVAMLCNCCSKKVEQGEWANLIFIDYKNIIHKVSVKLTNAVFDDQSRYLKIEGSVKNRMNEYQLFDLRNRVYRLDEHGHFLKPKSVGLPVIPLAAIKPDGSSKEESFTLIYKIEQAGTLMTTNLDYVDQFTLTGQINKIVISIPLRITSGTVTSRG